MKFVDGKTVTGRSMDQLAYIGDLVNVEGPLLSLLRTPRQNWLLLWCDTDGIKKHRYLLLPVSRADLIDYISKKTALRELITRDAPRYLLDVSGTEVLSSDNGKRRRTTRRTLKQIFGLAAVSEYLPSSDSYFDPDLSPDFSASSEFVPTHYDVKIGGEWFAADLQKFSAVYEQVYDFFYCTDTGFVTNIGSRVKDYLRAPWRGGFSRVNLFKALKNFVPSLHDLRVFQIDYASPGKIRFEALESLGEMIKATTGRYIENREPLLELEKKLRGVLTGHRLNSRDVSSLSDGELGLATETIGFIQALQTEVASTLDCVASIEAINEQSPNSVVSAKVVVSFLVRVKKLSTFQQDGLLGHSLSNEERLTGLIEVD